MMDEQAEGLKALLTFSGGGEPQFPQTLGHRRNAAGEAAPHPFLPLASPACWGLRVSDLGDFRYQKLQNPIPQMKRLRFRGLSELSKVTGWVRMEAS